MNNRPKPIGILKLEYPKALKISLTLSLLNFALFFYSFKSLKHENIFPNIPKINFEIDCFEPTKPALVYPVYPAKAESDDPLMPDIPVSLTNNGLLASLGKVPFLPPVNEPDVCIFESVREKPVLLKPARPYYPEIACKAGVEGTVVVKILIGKNGFVEKAKIFKSIPVLDDAALHAALKCVFKPARQRDKFVKIWMYIPFKFKLP